MRALTVCLILAMAGAATPAPAITQRPARPNDLFVCGTSWQRQRDALVRSRYLDSLRRGRPGRDRLALSDQPQGLPLDSGNVAVIVDDGTVTSPPNPFDLRNLAILFVPTSSAAYQVSVRSASFTPGTGTRVTLGDDDARAIELSPPFTFFGKRYTSVQLNSDGNLTFGEPDTASTERDLGRFSWGPPRIGPLFTDLDPTAGSVFYRNESDGILFVWDNVPAFGTAQYDNFSAKLFQNGNIEFTYGAAVATADNIVGISPGISVDGMAAVDFSTVSSASGLAGTVAEVFAATPQLSETSIARKFFRTHPDEFDQLVVFLSFPFDLQGAFSYELNVANDVQGIGLDPIDSSTDYGSAGRLKSFVMMGDIGAFPSDPGAEFMRTYNGLKVVAHEVAHRWLSFPLLQEGKFSTMSLLHETDQAHWSFFFNADASIMEGNQIVDRGATFGLQRFVTSEVTDRLSSLDRYLMGFEDPVNVPDMFYVKNPAGTRYTSDHLPSHTPSAFGGTRWDFTINDIISANGPRMPSFYQSFKVHRLGFILVTKPGQVVNDQVAKLQKLHDAFLPYFNQATQGQAWVVSNLQQAAGTTSDRIYFPYFEGDGSRYTGIAVANWGATPADILFRSFANTGVEISTPASVLNPRMITIPPGAQIAMLAEQIHNLSFTEPRNAWVQAETSSSQVTGFFLTGDVNQTFLNGAVAGNASFTNLYFTRASPAGGAYRDRISVVNPGDVEAHLRLTRMNSDGQPQGPAIDRVLGAHGRLADDLNALFPGVATNATGYVTITSDVGIIGYETFSGSATVYSLPAQPPSTATTLYAAQFASGPAGTTRYFTDINLINTGNLRRLIRIALIGNDGQPVAGAGSPAPFTLEPGQQRLARGEDLFALVDAVSASGITEGTLVVTADGPGVIGDVTFGDPVAGRFMAGMPLDGAPASNLVFSQVAEGNEGSGKSYFTGVAMHNPNSKDVSVTVEVFSETGHLTGTRTFTLGSGRRLAQVLPDLVPSVTRQLRGYIRISTSGGPIVAFELFGDGTLAFLAAVAPQVITP